MIPAEILDLCRLVKACCPSQQLDAYTPDAWVLILGKYSFDDARQAVLEIVSAPLDLARSRYVEPGHIVTGINRIRGRRLEATPMPIPPAGLDPAEYSDWHNRTREAIANGTLRDVVIELPGPAELGRFRELLADATPTISTTPEHPRRRRTPDVEQIVDQAQADADKARQLAELEARIAQEGTTDADA